MTMRALLFAAAAALPAPALAQHEGHADQGREVAQPAALPERQQAEQPHRAQDHSAHMPVQGPDGTQAEEEHSAHAPPAGDTAQPPEAHAGHGPVAEGDRSPPDRSEADTADTHAGHLARDSSADEEHAGHGLAGAVSPPVSGPPAEAFSGPEHAADVIFGDTAMAVARRELLQMHGDVPAYRGLIDRLEARIADGADRYLFDAQAWYGGDIDKLWLKAEGEGTFGEDFEGAEVQALWSHAISPWFDLQAGVRYDLGPGDDRGHLVLGVQGLAPYWIEVEAAAFLSDRGELTARIEAEHDVRLTQRLILQPRVELDFALQDVAAERTGAGLTTGSFGVRLRYQFAPRVGPYLGVEYGRAFGETRRLKAAANEDPGGVAFLAGIRAWF